MTDAKEPARYHVVRYTVTLIHEFPAKYDHAEFYFTEHNCFGNVIEALHDAHAVDDEFSVCNICGAEQAEYIGSFDTHGKAEAAGMNMQPKTRPYDLNPERRREALKMAFGEVDP